MIWQHRRRIKARLPSKSTGGRFLERATGELRGRSRGAHTFCLTTATAKPSRSNRSGNVVIGFSSRLQINSVPFCIGRDVRHGRFAYNCLFAFPKAESTDV